MDLEQKAIERIRLASDLSLKHYNKPLVCEYSGGKDSDVLLELFRVSGIPFEVHNSHSDEWNCDECHRKYNGWGISMNESNKIAKEILNRLGE